MLVAVGVSVGVLLGGGARGTLVRAIATHPPPPPTCGRGLDVGSAGTTIPVGVAVSGADGGCCVDVGPVVVVTLGAGGFVGVPPVDGGLVAVAPVVAVAAVVGGTDVEVGGEV